MKIVYNSEVNQARNKMGGYSKPIVALESTIITHGMPYPKNIQVAQEVEQIVRQNGAIPATIAILDGSIHIGLEDFELKKISPNQGCG
jgi:pseudouridine-5'-phosphate glycosidase